MEDNLPPIRVQEFIRDHLNGDVDPYAWNILNDIRYSHIDHRAAVELADEFGTTPEYWLNLQSLYYQKINKKVTPSLGCGFLDLDVPCREKRCKICNSRILRESLLSAQRLHDNGFMSDDVFVEMINLINTPQGK